MSCFLQLSPRYSRPKKTCLKKAQIQVKHSFSAVSISRFWNWVIANKSQFYTFSYFVNIFSSKKFNISFEVCFNLVNWSDFTISRCDILSVGQKKAIRWGKMTKCLHVFTCRYIWLFFAPRVVCFCPTYHFWKHFLIGSFRCIIINITYKFFTILKENIMNFHLISPLWLFDF